MRVDILSSKRFNKDAKFIQGEKWLEAQKTREEKKTTKNPFINTHYFSTKKYCHRLKHLQVLKVFFFGITGNGEPPDQSPNHKNKSEI